MHLVLSRCDRGPTAHDNTHVEERESLSGGKAAKGPSTPLSYSTWKGKAFSLSAGLPLGQ